MEVVLAEWLFESVQDFHVLTLDKRYFDIPGSVERWLYLYARKATGGANGVWKETLKSLYRKSASQQEYKHYASALRKLVKKNELPGLQLELAKSAGGDDMLLMERMVKREVVETKTEKAQPEQIELIEKTPLEDAWENVLEVMRKHLGEAVVSSWFSKLRLKGIEGSTLTYHAPTKFIAEWVETHYRLKLIEAWRSVGHPLDEIKIESPKRKLAA